MNLSKNLALIGKECVACGCCISVCPKTAISILSGITAQIDSTRCVGCGKCVKVCPAAVISVTERGALR